ncbi:MAG: tetraacyldisaccharide 4'-kinase [Melioribacteraceae bacterium]|nr:tetraacyldisaccharide 4'-kinase [Melioribacteraceae bacterium]
MLKLIRIILSPLLFLYALIINARNFLFDKNIFKTKKVNAKVISVGNITVGGSGKTPLVILIAELIKKINKKVGVLSRGYGRRSSGYIYVSDGKNNFSNVEKCGDEIILVADELKIPTAVSESRVKGANHFINDSDVEIIILDDAFQHRWIHRDLDLVIIDQRFLIKEEFVEQNLLPLGLMRETFDSLKRADAVIINRKFSEKAEMPVQLKKYFDNKIIFNAYYTAKGIYDVKTHNYFELNEFTGQKSLVVCGIAKPFSFLNILEKNGIDISNKLIYPDHANYTIAEIQEIRKSFYDTNSQSVLTTQKDAVKLTNFSKELDDIDIYYLKIELKIEEQNEFEKLILKSLQHIN